MSIFRQYQLGGSGISPSDLDLAKGNTKFKLSKQAEDGFDALKIASGIDQIAKRERNVAKLTEEIKEIAANPLGKKAGRPSSGKVRVHLMLRPETVKAFKSAGMGWQALISDILDAAAPKG